MKKLSVFLIMTVIAVCMLAGCAKNGTGKEDVKAPNAKTGTYEEMVAYLTAKGYIGEDTKPVDINNTAGYLTDNTGGEFTQTQIADKAYDYDGLWLFWWDLEKQTENYQVYTDMAANRGTIILGGGAAVLSTEARNGAFAIAFSGDYADKDKVITDFKALEDK